MKFKRNFKLLGNFFIYKNLTFPPFYKSLLFGIPFHHPFNKRVSKQRDQQRDPFLASLLVLQSFVFPLVAYFETVLFPLNKEGKGWMGENTMIFVIQRSQFCTRLPKSKEMEVKHYLYINFVLTHIKKLHIKGALCQCLLVKHQQSPS